MRFLLALGLAAGLAGCGDDATTTVTSASPVPAVNGASRLFTGTLTAGETQFYSFTLPQNSGVFVTLASVTGVDSREASTVELGLGLGVPRGTDCVASRRVVVTSALTPQLSEYTPQGVRCVLVSAPVGLNAPVRYAVRIGYFQ